MSGGIYINGIQKGLVAPLADSAGNDTVAEVVGNKTDTVAGTSVVALSKQILAATPSASDIADIKAVTDLIPDAGAMTSIAQGATLGTPVGVSLSADIAAVQSTVDTIDTSTGTTIPTLIGTPVGASIAADIAALNDLSAADVNAEVDTALNTIVPVAPTAGSLNDMLSKASGGNTFDKATDSLEALRDIIDTYNTADQADLDAILEDTGTTLPSTLSGLDTKIDTIDTVVDSIQTDLDNATDGLGALKLLIDAVQSTADAIETDTQDIQTQIGTAGAGLTAIPNVAQAAANSSGDSSGTLSYLDAGGEQTVVELTTTTRKVINGVWLDLVNMTQNGTIKAYYKIDGTNYREMSSSAFVVLTDKDGFYLSLNMGITNDFKVTYTEGVDEGAARDIPYSLVYRTIE
jgi:hypothetical protein